MAQVSLEKVSKSYRPGVDAVSDVSLEVSHGEFVSFVGPSGCGKSTTLNLIAGLEDVTSGHIRVDGQVVNHLSPKERDIAMVFQSYALYPHLDVRGNLSFPLKVAGMKKKQISARVDETASMLGLEGLLDRRPKELSGGQRQRVALGRALVRRPKVFLFDEPLSNLDASLRSQMRAEMKRLHQTLGATFIYVTHDQVEAMTLSERVVVMNAGRIQQIGSPADVYSAPENLFVASFFGAPPMNLLRPETLGFEGQRGVRMGVRSENIELRRDAAAGAALAGRVCFVELLGADSQITVEVGEERLVARASASFGARPGDAVWIGLQPERVLRFDIASGRRL